MRSFACSYTSRQKTASRIFLLIICEFRIIRPPLHPLTPTPVTCGFTAGTDYYGVAVPPPWFSGPSHDIVTFCDRHPPATTTSRSRCGTATSRPLAIVTRDARNTIPTLASYKPRATSYASRVASIARRALTASPIAYVSIPCARNSSESSSHERYPTAMTTVSKPRNS